MCSGRYQPSISSTFYEQFLRRYSVAKKLQSQTVIRENLHAKHFPTKRCASNVDEIDTRSISPLIYDQLLVSRFRLISMASHGIKVGCNFYFCGLIFFITYALGCCICSLRQRIGQIDPSSLFVR